MKEIRQIIAAADMTENARKISLDIFEILAQAEAKAHNVPAEEVHFHEVGAVDSIVDILSVAVCLDNLGITDVIVPVLYEGIGTIRCQHGILPVPVPAVTNIVQQCGLDLKITQVKGELVTPTGAAIVAAVRTGKTLPENFEIEKIGIGAGKRTYECPGILRAMLIRNTDSDQSSDDKDVIYKLETNIDDCSGEVLGFVMERLFEAGARDVHYTPVYMKKNRPAWLLTVICKEEVLPGIRKPCQNLPQNRNLLRRSLPDGRRSQPEPRLILQPMVECAKIQLSFFGDTISGKANLFIQWSEYEEIH